MSIRIDGTNTIANPGITGGDAEENPEYQMLASLKFYPDLIQCVQTLITKIETLEQ